VGVKGGFSPRFPFGCHGTWVSWCIWEDVICNEEQATDEKYREVKEATDEYKKCSSPHAADSGAKISCIRYSELHSLPYFNTVDHFLIDPMRNLFPGVLEDIGNAITEGDARFADSNGRDVISKHRFLVGKSCRCLLLRIWVLLSIQL